MINFITFEVKFFMNLMKVAFIRSVVLLTLAISIGSAVLEEFELFDFKTRFTKTKNFSSQTCYTELENLADEDNNEHERVICVTGVTHSIVYLFPISNLRTSLFKKSTEEIARPLYLSYRQLLI